MAQTERNDLLENLIEAQAFMDQKLEGRKPTFAMILGSGLNGLADKIENQIVVPYDQVPHMRAGNVNGHSNRFISGTLSGVEVIAMQGRLHGYDGFSAVEVAFPVWLMARLGVETIVVTNAAGAINESYAPGDFCLMMDHINFMGRNPMLDTRAAAWSERWFSMTDAYDPQLRQLAKRVAAENGITVHEGVYLGLPGPSFETPAEIRAFRMWGADTVAMSAIDEVLAARQVGLRIMGISMISNMAAGVGSVAGVGGANPTAEEIWETAALAAQNFEVLMRGVLAQL